MNTQIQDQGAQYLADALQNNAVRLNHPSDCIHFRLSLFTQVLTILLLATNQIQYQGAQYLAKVLQNNTVRLNRSFHIILFSPCIFHIGTQATRAP